MAALILQLAPFFTAMFFAALLVYYRLHKKFSKEPITSRWDYLDRNPVEFPFVVILLALAGAMVPGVLGILKTLVP